MVPTGAELAGTGGRRRSREPIPAGRRQTETKRYGPAGAGRTAGSELPPSNAFPGVPRGADAATGPGWLTDNPWPAGAARRDARSSGHADARRTGARPAARALAVRFLPLPRPLLEHGRSVQCLPGVRERCQRGALAASTHAAASRRRPATRARAARGGRQSPRARTGHASRRVR